MRISVIQHTLDTPPCFTTPWLQNQGYDYKLVRAFKGDQIPKAEEVDWLIVLGGGMNIDEEQKHPFLREEKKLVEQILKEEKLFLGLCLGGQMLARVMGAEVRKHTEWEVGWRNVTIDNKTLGLKNRPQQEKINVFQWHQDTFDIPKGATAFASNTITANQGFVTSNGLAVATQFHPEADEAWVRECADDELPQGRYVQTQDEMLIGLNNLEHQSSWFFDVLTHLANKTKLRAQN